MKPHPVWWQHIHLTCDITATIWVITPTVQATSHPIFSWHLTRHMCGIVCIIQDITSSYFDLKSPFGGHNTCCIRHRVHCICVITTLSMISQPLYVWYCIQYRCDILSTVFMTSYRICMTSQTCVLFTPNLAYVWHHLHYRRCHIHSITASHNLYDFTSTSGMTSHPLYQTLHPLYLCHQNLSNVITLTFEWHHTHLLCDITCTI